MLSHLTNLDLSCMTLIVTFLQKKLINLARIERHIKVSILPACLPGFAFVTFGLYFAQFEKDKDPFGTTLLFAKLFIANLFM